MHDHIIPAIITRKHILTLLALAVLAPATIYVYEWRKTRSYIDRDDYYMHDDQAGHVHRPNYIREVTWTEHGVGKIKMATNNLGFREDTDTQFEKATGTIRVLVTGDSHTDGVVNNCESFSNLLESALNRDTVPGTYEVINGGTGFYSFRNYTGFLRKYSALNPDVFVLVLYSGNDYIESIFQSPDNLTFLSTLKSFWYRIRKRMFQISTGMASSQSTNQLLYFKMYPGAVERSMQIARQHLAEIQLLCHKQQIELLVITLPSRLDVVKSLQETLLARSDWGQNDVQMNQVISAKIHTWLDSMGVDNLNLYEFMMDDADRYFWRSDAHLSCEGHKCVSDLLHNNEIFAN